jgi:4'-phosphopantetheinyl transferase
MTNLLLKQTPLGPQEIRLLSLDFGKASIFSEEARALLSPDESERAASFAVQRFAERFVLFRGLLRRCLGDLMNVAPSMIRFEYGLNGKPRLSGSDAAKGRGLSFNLSGSGDFGVIALAYERQLGVDIEKIRPLDSARLAQRYFSPPEAAVLSKAPADRREETFFHYWTAKEAYLKARGEGISLGLRGYSFSDPRETPPRLTWTTWGQEEAKRWTFHRFRPDVGYVGTLAYSGGEANIKEFHNLLSDPARGA